MNRRTLLIVVVVASALTVGAGGAVATPTSTASSSSTAAGVVECAQSCNQGALASGASMQADDQSSSNDSETPTVVAQVDDDVRVTAARYDEANNTYYVTLENTGETGTQATLTEMVGGGGSSGSGTFGIERVRIRPGSTVEVAVTAERRGGTAGVTITTDASISQGRAAFIKDVESGPSVSIVHGPAGWPDVWVAILATVGFAAFIVIVSAWHVVASRHTAHDQPDLSGGRS